MGTGMFKRDNRCLLLAVALVLPGCAAVKVKQSEKTYWPKPPELPRYVFEANIHNELDILRVTRSERLRRAVIGTDPKAQSAFVKPYDVAVRHGRIVVSDTMANTLHLFDIPSRRLMRIGRSEKGLLQNPLGVAIDDEANIYAADSAAKQIVVYNATGHFLKRIGGPEQLVHPVDVAVTLDGSRIYVVDVGGISSDKHRLVIYDGDGQLLATVGSRGTAEGRFNLPAAVAVAPDGRVFVLDSGNFRVQIFDGDGNFQQAWGELGRGFGHFARPRGLAIGGDGNVFVTDAAFRNFQIFTPDGRLLMWVGGDTMKDEPGGYVLPAGIAVDETERIYVVDQLFRKVDVIRRLDEEERKRLALRMRRKGIGLPGEPPVGDLTATEAAASAVAGTDASAGSAGAVPQTPEQAVTQPVGGRPPNGREAGLDETVKALE